MAKHRGAAGPPLPLMKFKLLGVRRPPAGPGGTARRRGSAAGGRELLSEAGVAASPRRSLLRGRQHLSGPSLPAAGRNPPVLRARHSAFTQVFVYLLKRENVGSPER